MSTLLTLRDISKSFGARTLFLGISMSIHQGERIGLVGANGSGKSTLLKIMIGQEDPDQGERTVRKGARLAYLPQKDDFADLATVWDVAAHTLAPLGLAAEDLHARANVVLGRVGFTDHSQAVADLSGGWRKRLALARALMLEPDLLLLDEPTNHLDLESILWLEDFLAGARFSYMVISHDRSFLENVTTRTIDLSRAYPEGYLSVDGPYSVFLEKREDFLVAQAGQEKALASRVRFEIAWLRRGCKARTTKAKARKDEAARLMRELDETRDRNARAARAGVDFSSSGRQTKRLLAAEGVAKSLGGRTLFSGLDLVLSPGMRLGLAGRNGSGKSTLLKVLAGELAADSGAVRRAPGLEVAVFGQEREQLDPDVPLRRAFAPHGDSVFYRGGMVHVATWAKRFLFRVEQLDLPVGLLSGGEQARVLIARLMLRPADVLLLDEPTNDLDIPTLEVLEESLSDFPGAVVLVTHDRYLLDSVSTMLLGLDGQGGAQVYGDFAQWRQAIDDAEQPAPAKPAALQTVRDAVRPKSGKKLTYKEQREYDGMEESIAQAEQRLADSQAELDDPAVATHPEELEKRLAVREDASREVDILYARWEELEAKLAEAGE